MEVLVVVAELLRWMMVGFGLRRFGRREFDSEDLEPPFQEFGRVGLVAIALIVEFWEGSFDGCEAKDFDWVHVVDVSACGVAVGF